MAASLALPLLLLLLCACAAAECIADACSNGSDHCTVASGPLTAKATWCGGNVPPSGATNKRVTIEHDVTFSKGSYSIGAGTRVFLRSFATLDLVGGAIYNDGNITVPDFEGNGHIIIRNGAALVNRNGGVITLESGFYRITVTIETGGTFNNLQGGVILSTGVPAYSCYGRAPTCGFDTWSCCPNGCTANGECAECAICRDSPVMGIDGSRYVYVGTPNRIVSLISDPIVQVNSLFVRDRERKITVMSNMAFRVCDHSLVLHANGTALVDGKPVSGFNSSAKRHPAVVVSPALSYHFVSAKVVAVRFGMWRASVLLMGAYVNLHRAEHITGEETRLHGVYGVTGRKDHHLADKRQCQPGTEGGCALPGKWQDYELPAGAPLTSTEWAYTQYDARQCGAMVAAAAGAQRAADEGVAARAAAAKALRQRELAQRRVSV